MASSTADPDPAASSTPLHPSILFDAHAYIGDRPNGTTAEELTSSNRSIQVSIWAAAPPSPSRLFVHIPNLDPDLFCDEAHIVCSADGVLLLRVCIVWPKIPLQKKKKEEDYFIYRYQAGRPSLRRLPKPLPFNDDEAGLLPRGEHFTIAVLSVSLNGFNLQLFKSETWNWTNVSKVPVVTKQRPFPIQIPRNAARLNMHITTTVITLGGKGGTMGWVDLWRGILFCDVLSATPTLRGVPLPLPSALINHHKGIDGCPKPNRGIAVVDGCLRMVELDVHGEILPNHDPETGLHNFRVDNWELCMYTNRRITGAWEDWQLEHRVEASNINIDPAMHWKLRHSGLLYNKTEEGKERKLQNLLPCQPTLSLDDQGAVYLLTKVKFMQPEAWVLAVDVKGNKIQALAEFGIDRTLGLSLAYCPSRISSYMDA
ncbi:uncharacterized protein LOC102720955 [Oryza brachyantha]|uniref:DUF1618 domain-containing protein n=1 Tax=Oryza brachyantha TaxID=4533 RepID=J3LHX8_ORYBR|nr:uncharacterized protein LOC102720955 [Oryza brachyantha]XP_006648040.2 uncharacterized protein LOC102720955 [Oryza brachyantha]